MLQPPAHQHPSRQEQPQLRRSFLLPAQSDLQLGSTMGAQGSQQIPRSSLEPLPSGCHGIPTPFGHLALALGVVLGTQTGLLPPAGLGGSSAACSGLPWAFCHGKGLQPG